ncbi:MAG TPA: DUF2442 domain-containing protein [Rhodocyclaceae bacterium]|nr:DUF2442 domain-containing protein [Rhodocyclaceae bacterium]
MENATPSDLTDTEISRLGLGVHFPRINVDLYVPALLNGLRNADRGRLLR